MNRVSDDIIRQAQEGNHEAFQKIYEANYKHVYYYALKLCRNEANAKDIAQETFIQVFRFIKDLRELDYFNLWLNRIVYSKFLNFLKKNKEVALDHQDLNYFVEQSDEAKKRNAKNLLIDDEVLQRLLKKIPEKQSEVLSLMYLKQYTIPEIAKLLGCPEGTIKSRLDQAKKKMAIEVASFEKKEGRKLSFGADMLVPTIGLGLLGKCKYFIQHSLASSSQTLLAVSVTSMVAVSAVAVNETKNYIEQKPEPLQSNAFQAVPYDDEVISNAKEAYYILLNWATDKDNELAKEDIMPIYISLQKSNSNYYNILQHNSNWIEAYKKII